MITSRRHLTHRTRRLLRLSVRHLIRSSALVSRLCSRASLGRAIDDEPPSRRHGSSRGERVRFSRCLSSWTRFDELLGIGDAAQHRVEPQRDSLGSAHRAAVCDRREARFGPPPAADFRLTAGNLVAVGDSRVVTAPLIPEYGLTRRLTVGVVVPLVETRTTLFAQLNPRSGAANVGPNPALANADQLARNAALVTSSELRRRRCNGNSPNVKRRRPALAARRCSHSRLRRKI